MFFTVKNKKYLTTEQLKTNTLLKAYYVIKNYPLNCSEKLLDSYLQQYHDITLKDLCVKILLKLSHYKDEEGNVVLLFKDYKYDKYARLVTYGNGAVAGSPILKIALKN